jgi:hypothetical protein
MLYMARVIQGAAATSCTFCKEALRLANYDLALRKRGTENAIMQELAVRIEPGPNKNREGSRYDE